MQYSIRLARAEDLAPVADFTTDTFDWGDYIADVFEYWRNDPQGHLIVGVDGNDRPVAVGHGTMLSRNEGWLQGFRVHPDHRRQGLALAMQQELVAWAGEQGAHIVRLLTEAWNTPAQLQVEKGGFNRSGTWTVGRIAVAGPQPATPSNGGQRAKARRKLEPAHSSEAVPAWASWRSGPLVRAARGLHVAGWRWSQLRPEHLEHAAKKERFWTSHTGWVMTRRDDDVLYADWFECDETGIFDMLKSIIDLAIETHAELVRVTVPDVDWAITAMETLGFESSPMYLYERSL